MRDAIKRSFLLGLGAASMTKRQIEKTVKQLVKKNHINGREARAMLSKARKHAQKEGKRLAKLAQAEAQRLASEAKVMSKRHMQTMNKSLKSMDAKLTAEGKRTLQKIMKQMVK